MTLRASRATSTSMSWCSHVPDEAAEGRHQHVDHAARRSHPSGVYWFAAWTTQGKARAHNGEGIMICVGDYADSPRLLPTYVTPQGLAWRMPRSG
eukprot:32382-Eustigmatos_ZCMA.PRE.1